MTVAEARARSHRGPHNLPNIFDNVDAQMRLGFNLFQLELFTSRMFLKFPRSATRF
jgi:hypothetical protein